MELYLNATSPYARLVRIVLLEKGLMDAVTLKWCDPWADDADLLKANPAGRIPALVTEDGTTLSESMLIAMCTARAFLLLLHPFLFALLLHLLLCSEHAPPLRSVG